VVLLGRRDDRGRSFPALASLAKAQPFFHEAPNSGAVALVAPSPSAEAEIVPCDALCRGESCWAAGLLLAAGCWLLAAGLRRHVAENVVVTGFA
jgi:hypothetical protein